MLKAIEVIAAREGVSPEEVYQSMKDALAAAGLTVDPEEFIVQVSAYLCR